MVEGLADGSEAGLAHLSHAAATGSAAPRPKRSPDLVCPILRGGREECGEVTPVLISGCGAPGPAQEAPYPCPSRLGTAGVSTPALSSRRSSSAPRTARWCSQSNLHEIGRFLVSGTQAKSCRGLVCVGHGAPCKLE